MNILFVCAGNICRSPMAEAMLKSKLAARQIDGVQVSSCGLDADANHSKSAHSGLQLVLGDPYKALQNFHSRPISRDIVRAADLILAMENGQVREILSRFPDSHSKTFTITSYSGAQGEVVDFVDDGRRDLLEWLKSCYEILDHCLDRLADRISTSQVSDTAGEKLHRPDAN